MKKANGYLIIIGGAEDKSMESEILNNAADMFKNGDIFSIITTATLEPEKTGENYKNIFSKLGLKNIEILNINSREDANDIKFCSVIKKSKGLFFTGGDQLRITSILGGTKTEKILKEVYENGGIIIGTSAGASAMSSVMIVAGDENEPVKLGGLKMAPGLDLLSGCILDQHFDQRGRFGRLLSGVAENPGTLGIGIGENTAVKVFPDIHMEVLGENTVTVIDGTAIEASNISELKPDEMLAIVGAKVHILPFGYGFDFKTKKVLRLKSEEKK